MSLRSNVTLPSFAQPEDGFAKSLFNLLRTSFLRSASQSVRFSSVADHSVVVHFPELNSAGGDLVDGFTQLGGNIQDTASGFRAGTFPYMIIFDESTPAAATIKSLTEELVCASLAIMIWLAKGKSLIGI